jgi:hypothetical protein
MGQGARPAPMLRSILNESILRSSHTLTMRPTPGREVTSPGLPDRGQMRYLRAICELLWPAPAVVTVDGSAGDPSYGPWSPGGNQANDGGTDFALIPGARRPPLLVPVGHRAAAAAVRHYSGRSSRTARMGAKALSLYLASGLGRNLLRARVRVTAPPGTGTIETYLASVLSEGLQVSMYLGPARANRKPVLELLTPAGEPVAFAKIGVNPLTCNLVRAERGALDRLSHCALTQVTVPKVLHHDQWRDLEVLVISAESTWRRRQPLSAAQLAAAMYEVASIGGLRSEPLRGSAYLRRLRDQLAMADEGPERAALGSALDLLEAGAKDTCLTFGAWHGDWSPWNMASTGRGLLVWDWERFAVCVPLGFDVLHHWLQTRLARSRSDPRAAAQDCTRNAAQLLAPFGVNPFQARLTGIAYLAELAIRYLVDRQAEMGARNGDPGTWLIPTMVTELDRLWHGTS